jgi:hypothetical protein
VLRLYRHPTAAPDVPRLGVLRQDDVVDVHLACLTSLAGHMKLRRAEEIAAALAPPSLLAFLDGGRHSWNALHDSVDRLGDALLPGLDAPTGHAVVVPKPAATLVPLLPPGAGWSADADGEWDSRPVTSPGTDAEVVLRTDGRAYLPEYLVVIGSTTDGASMTVASAAAAIALVVISRPSRPESACVLRELADAAVDEPALLAIAARAVVDASADQVLQAGDIVRCGPSVVTGDVDLREPAPAFVDAPGLT